MALRFSRSTPPATRACPTRPALLPRPPARMPAPRASSKPVPLIKRFRTPVKRRKRKQVSLDEPKRIDVDPASPSFAGRLVSEINAAPGPKSLAKLVRDFGPLLDAQHLSMALGRLAGYYTGTDSAQPDRQLYRSTAVHCATLLRPLLSSPACGHVATARAVYALSKLQVHDAALLAAAVEASFDRLHVYAPSTYAGLIAGLAAYRHAPPRPWLDRFCLETYSRFSQFDARELAAVAHALQRLGHAPSGVWLAGACRAFRGGPRTTASALVKFLHAAVKLGAALDFNWLCAYLAEAGRRIDAMRPRELACIMWAMARVRHTPDAVYLESWYTSCAKRMQNWQLHDLTLALHSLAQLPLLPPLPGAYTAAALRHARLRLLQQPQQQQQQPRAPDAPAAASSALLSELLWSITNLKLKPSAEWMDTFLAVFEQQLPHAAARSVADVLWSLAVLGCRPSAVWLGSVTQRVSALVNGPREGMELRELVLVAWAAAELGMPEQEAWANLAQQRLQTVLQGADQASAAQQLQAVAAAAASRPKEGGSSSDDIDWPMMMQQILLHHRPARAQPNAVAQPSLGKSTGAEGMTAAPSSSSPQLLWQQTLAAVAASNMALPPT